LKDALDGGLGHLRALANLYRQFLGYSNITQIESGTNQSYDSLQTSLRLQSWHNLTMQFAYTWSHEIDIQSGYLGSTNISGSGGTVSNPFNLRYDRGSGVLDRRHIFNANYDYRLPFWLHGGNILEHGVLGGWEVSGVTVAQAGSPINVTYSPDTLGLGGGTVNHTQFNGVDTGFTDGNFGQVTSTYDPRELQFGGKLVF
jgi:hypothetical protein